MESLTSMASFLSTFIFSLLFSSKIVAESNPSSSLKVLPVPAGGSEAFVFDGEGRLYTGVNDGRILRHYEETGFVDFAYTAPNRDKTACDGTNDLALWNVCGRTLGLAFHIATGQLYVADVTLGLLVVGPEGGKATQLLTSFGGVDFKFLDGIDVDQKTGKVYITDITELDLMEYLSPNRTGIDGTGRLIEYDPITKSAKLLQNKLRAPAGVAISHDSSFILFTLNEVGKIAKFWLRGPIANTCEDVSNISTPDNITRPKSKKYYWVASNVKNDSTVVPMGVKIDENGKILQKLLLGEEFYGGITISEVHEYGGDLYIASVGVSFIGVIKNYDDQLIQNKDEL